MLSRVQECGWSGPVNGTGAADLVAALVLDLGLTDGVGHGSRALLDLL